MGRITAGKSSIISRLKRLHVMAVVATILGAVCVASMCYGAKGKIAAPSVQPAADAGLADICRRKQISLPLKNARITVDKKARRLRLYEGGSLLKTYPVAFGPNLEGHKTREGDGRTPEGKYYLIKHTSPAFGRCFYIAYPNEKDAREGHENDVISKKSYLKVKAATTAKTYPPSNTGLGGQILLHGTKDRSEQNLTSIDWTLGCIAMENADIMEILNAIPDNARPEIQISPSLNNTAN